MADQSVRGRFVWHELVTPDVDAAHAFYGKVIGWKRQPWDEDPSYVMFAAPRGAIGATVERDSVAPHWLPYIGTGDIEQTLEQATQLGGSVVKEVETLSTGSRYAVLQDPYGAEFGVYESAQDYGEITPPKTGEHSWHELLSPDHQAAFEFYAALFGWEKLREHDMGPMGTYLIYGLDGDALGGMMNTMDSAQGSAWLGYVHVKDVNQTARKVKSAGGQIINGPMEVPGGDWIIAARDPQGAMFAAHASAANMKKAEKKAQQAKDQDQDQGQLALETESPPPAVEESESLDDEEPVALEQPAEEPAREAPARKARAKKTPARKASAKKAPARKAPARKAPPAEALPAEAPSEETPAQRAPARKSPAKKAPARKAPARKAPARKAPAKKAPVKKTPAKKAPAKKAPAKKAPARKKTKQPARKSGARQSGARQSVGRKSGARKSALTPKQKSSKQRPVAKRAGSKKSAARGGVKKGARKVAAARSGGKKKAAKQPRKAK